MFVFVLHVPQEFREDGKSTSFNTINLIAAIYGIFEQYILAFLALQVMTFLIYKKNCNYWSSQQYQP